MLNDNYIRSGLLSESSSVFEEVFHAFYSDLCNYALRFISSYEDAEEIVQQCFIKLWEKRDSADKIQSFRAYLYRSVHNKCLNQIEHEKIKQQYVQSSELKLRQIYAADHCNIFSDDIKDKLEMFINGLPEKNKEVFMLRFFEGYNTKEVSKMLNITIRTVETHISKSLKILRENFKKAGALKLFVIFLVASYVILLEQLS